MKFYVFFAVVFGKNMMGMCAVGLCVNCERVEVDDDFY